MNLSQYGWNSYFDKNFQQYKDSYNVGRVALQHKASYRIYTERGEMKASLAGKMFFHCENSELPVVGDWVLIQYIPGENEAIIHGILERKTKFSRGAAGDKITEQVIATNIDTVFIITGLDNDMNLRRIERYLLLTWESGSNAVILLSKADLCSDVEEKIQEVQAIAFGVPVIAISAHQQKGIEDLYTYIRKGETIVFLGSSGVGKSTLVNCLIGEEKQKVREVRKFADRGKHTTTHRELILLPSGGIIMDTPGMRELQLWSSESSLSNTFDDIEELAQGCRFRDCQHEFEPGCNVQEAIDNGELDFKRLKNYQKMQREILYVERKKDKVTASNSKAKWKKITKLIRQNNKKKF